MKNPIEAMKDDATRTSEQERVVAQMEKLAKRLRKSLWRASGRPTSSGSSTVSPSESTKDSEQQR
jgi:hypothetical protein